MSSRQRAAPCEHLRAGSARVGAGLGTPKRGECFVYYRGRLATERFEGLSALSEADRRELGAVAGLALALAEQGRLHLLQRRQ